RGLPRRHAMICIPQARALASLNAPRPTRRQVAAGLAAMPVLLAGPRAQAQSLKKGGTLVAAIQDNPPHLLTGIAVDILTICVAGQIYDTLIKMDSKFELHPSLAKSWQVSADGL